MTARTIHPQHCRCRDCSPVNLRRVFVAVAIVLLLALIAGLRGVL